MDATTERMFELTEKLRQLRDSLCDGLVERYVAVRLAILAALAGEHLLLLGPPGTAKSLVARRLHVAVSGGHYFERLLTRFTVPEELFGPLSIKGLEEDRYERLTASYLPSACVAFLDEIFKANSAILNSLLTLLNEREFDNGTSRQQIPLVAVVGASNELPEGEELDALYDRFLLRLHLGPVSKDSFPELLALRGDGKPKVPDDLRLTSADLGFVQGLVDSVEVPGDVVSLLCDLREWCTSKSIQVSDRRWRKVVRLLQVSALSNGRQRVSVWDAWLLQHCLWEKPEDRNAVFEWYALRVGASEAMDPSRLTRVVVSWEGQLKRDQDSRSQMRDSKGRLLYKGPKGEPTPNASGAIQANRDGEPLFLAPADARSSNWGDPLADRTNKGNGYTRSELSGLCVQEKNHGPRQFQHWSEKDRYLANTSNRHMEEVDFPPIIEPTRHKEPYVRDCLSEVERLERSVNDYRQQLLEHVSSMEKEIRDHLWVTEDFVAPASESLAQTQQEVETLLARVGSIRKGFELLPKETDEPGLAVISSGGEHDLSEHGSPGEGRSSRKAGRSSRPS